MNDERSENIKNSKFTMVAGLLGFCFPLIVFVLVKLNNQHISIDLGKSLLVVGSASLILAGVGYKWYYEYKETGRALCGIQLALFD